MGDLVYVFERAGIRTVMDLSKLAAVGSWISNKLSRPTSSRAGAALEKGQAAPPNDPPVLSWELVNETDALL